MVPGFIILISALSAAGQTPLKTDTYYFISNKSMPNDQVINYSKEGKNFNMQNPIYRWKFVSESGHWEIDPVSQKYIWVNSAPANQYKIQVLINGKFWALSSTADAYPILAQVSITDMYQNWVIEAQADGYYRITNVGLRNANSPYTNLFVDGSKNSLFLSAWDEAKSFNGRWFLIMAGTINPGDDADRFDNRRMTLSSVSANKKMCLKYHWTSDATGENLISPCATTTSDHFVFQKTINGSYLMKIETSNTGMPGGTSSVYLNNYLKERSPEEIDILAPDPNDTWNISDLGNNTFMIAGTATGMTFELVKGYYNPSSGGWNSSKPDYVEMRRWDGRNEQRWFLSE